MININNESIIFVDSQVQNSESLLSGIGPGINIHHINAYRDGLTEINEILDQYHHPIDAIHIISHGEENSLFLGTTNLSLDNLHEHRHIIANWADDLSDDADILFYGCNVAQGTEGQAFIKQIDELTGADVAASTDLTGNATLGGDWDLEFSTGIIEAPNPFAAEGLASFEGTLGTLGGTLWGTQNFDGVTVNQNITLIGDVVLNVDDFTLGENFRISGNNDATRDNLTINSSGTVTLAGDIFGGGLKDITINAKDIIVEGTSLISTRYVSGLNHGMGLSIGDSGNLTLQTEYTFRDSEDSLNQVFQNPNPTIEVKAGAQLLAHVHSSDTEADGDISLISLDETLQTNLLPFTLNPHRSATVNVTGATLKGNDIEITASGLDPTLLGGIIGGEASSPGLAFANDLLLEPLIAGSAARLVGTVLPASVEVRISQAEITLSNSNIASSGSVTVNSTATVDSSVRALRGIYASGDSAAGNAAKLTTHFAAAVGYGSTTATTTLQGTQINAGSDVTIGTKADTLADVQARLFGNLQFGGQGANRNEYGFTTAVAVTNTTSKVTVDVGSSITSGGNVAIEALGDVDARANSNTSIFTEGNAAAGVAVNVDNSEVKATIQGDITAAGNISSEESFDITGASINGAANTFLFENHGFNHGEVVTYSNGSNGSDITGLADGESYVVQFVDGNRIQLARASAIDVGTVGLNEGVQHSLSRQRFLSITPPTTVTLGPVNTTANTVQLYNHGLTTGDQVIYRTNGTAPEGLFGDTRYYAVVVDSHRIQLSDETQQVAVDSVDINSNTIQAEEHGFSTGDEVVYRVDGTAIAGLADHHTYYAIVVDSNQIRLADTKAAAHDETAITLTSAGEDSVHVFETYNPLELSTTGSGSQTLETFAALSDVVDIDSNVITLQNHGLKTGQEVIVRGDTTEDDEDIGGALDNHSYYAIVLDTNRIQLAANLDNVVTGTAVDIDDVGIGIYHQLEYYDQDATEITFSSFSGTVDNTANTLTLHNHGLYNGQLVRYDQGGGAISGLTSGQSYFAIVLDDDTIQLANSHDDVDTGTAVDLLYGYGINHRLSFLQNATRFDPTVAVDGETDVFTLNNHGFQSGDAVIYNFDATYSEERNISVSRALNPSEAVDLVNDTLAISAQNLTTGDKVIYQAEYFTEAGTALGGLASEAEYFVIKVDDGTIKLATSEANALAGNSINLTSYGSGQRHLLITPNEDSILVDDREIRGLDNGEVYYVTVIDANTFRLAEDLEGAEAAQIIDLSNGANIGTGHTLTRATSAEGETPGIYVNATLEARDRARATGSARSTPKLRAYLRNPDLAASLGAGVGSGNGTGGLQLLNQNNAGNILGGKTPLFDNPIQGTNRFSIGLGVAVNVVDHDVLAETGSDTLGANPTVLKSNTDIAVNAYIRQRVQTRVAGQTGKEGAGLALGLGFSYAEYDNSARSIVQGNSQLDARQAINVTSLVEYPFLFNYKQFDDEELFDSDVLYQDRVDRGLNIVNLAKDFLIGGNLLLSKVTNTFAVSKNTGKKDKKKTDQINGGSYGFNGTIAVNDYDNTSEAIIKSGASVNQDSSYRTSQQSVNVTADTDMLLVGFVGLLHLDLALDLIPKVVKNRNISSAFNVLGNTAQNGFGVSVFAELLNNTTTAKIERGSRVHTGTYGDGLGVKANENVIMVSFTQSGADVNGFGLSGAGAGLDYISNTTAHLESGVQVTGGGIDVLANSDAWVVNSVASLITSGNIGVGLAVALNLGERKVRAIIGDDKTVNSTGSPLSINVAGDVNVDAQVRGAVISFGLGVNKTTTVTDSSPSQSQQGSNNGSNSGGSGATGGSSTGTGSSSSQSQQGSNNGSSSGGSGATGGSTTGTSEAATPGLRDRFSSFQSSVGDSFINLVKKYTYEPRPFALGVTGGVAGNIRTETAQAYIYNNNNGVGGRLQTSGKVNVNSENQTFTFAASTLLTWAEAKKRQNSTSNNSGNAGNQGGSTNSGSGTGNQADQTIIGVTAGASFNRIEHTTQAFIEGRGALINARDVTLNASKERERGSRTLALAVTPGVSYSGNGSGTASVSVSGSVALNLVESKTESYIRSSQINITSGIGGVSSTATDTAGYYATAGALALSLLDNSANYQGAGTVGASFALNNLNSSVKSYSEAAIISAPIGGDAGVNFSADSDWETLAISIAGSAAINTSSQSSEEKSEESNVGVSAALVGAISLNNIASHEVAAYVSDSFVMAPQGSLQLNAEDRSNTLAIAGGVSLAIITNKETPIAVSVGASIAINNFNSQSVQAYLRNANVQSIESVDINATSTAKAGAYAIVGSGAVAAASDDSNSFAISVAAAGAAAANSDDDRIIKAQIINSQIKILKDGVSDLSRVSVQALDDTDSQAVALGLAFALGVGNNASSAAVGVGLAVAANEVDHTVEANVQGSTLQTATGTYPGGSFDVTVKARSKPTIETINVGGAGAVGASQNGSVGVGIAAGLSLSYTTLSNSVTADIDQSSIIHNAGFVDVRALLGEEDHSGEDPTIHTVGGSLALASAWSQRTGVSVAVAASVAVNKIEDNTVRASINNARVTAAADITVRADFNPRIGATNFGIAAAVGGGGQLGVQAGVTGVGSYNTLSNNTIEALVTNGAVVSSSAGAVSVQAKDEAELKAHGGTGSLAVGASTQGSAVNVALGVSVAVNEVGSDHILRAQIGGNAMVSANGDIKVEAIADSTIEALNISLSAAAGGGQQGGVSVGTALIGSFNYLYSTAEATIEGANTQVTSHNGAVKVIADNTTTLDADGGAFSLAASFGQNTGVSVGVGAAVAVNELRNRIRSTINDAAVTARTDIEISADANNRIEAINIGGSVAAGFSGNAGVGVGVVGAGSYNALNSEVIATIENQANVTAQTGDVRLTAQDTSTIQADGGAISVAVGGGSTAGVGVSVGLSIAINKLSNTLKTSIDSSTVTAGQDVSLASIADATINTATFGGSLAVGIGGNAGVGVALSGVGATNDINNSIQSSIENGSQVTARGLTPEIVNGVWVPTGNVSVKASDTSEIIAEAYAASAAIGGAGQGAGVGVSGAIAVGNNHLNSTIEAFIGKAGNAADSTRVTAARELTVEATSTNTVEATVVTASFAVGAALVGVGVAVSGVVAENEIHNTVGAAVRNGTNLDVTDGATIAATDTSEVKAHYGASSLAFGTGVGVALAFAKTETTFTTETNAYVEDVSWAGQRTPDVTITATETATFETLNYIVSAGLGIVAVSGAGANSSTTIESKTRAYATGDENWSVGELTIRATSTTDSHAQVHGGAGAGALAGAVAAGGSTVSVTDNSLVSAYLDLAANKTLTATGDVTIEAIATPTIKADALFAGAALALLPGAAVSIAGTRATATLNPTITAYVGDNITINANNLTVRAKQALPENSDYSVQALATTAVVAAALGVSPGSSNAFSLDLTFANAHANSTVRAYIGNNATILTPNGDITVEAINHSKQFAGKEGVASLGLTFSTGLSVSGGHLEAQTHSNKLTEAWIGTNATIVTNTLTLNASGENEAKVGGITFGVAAGLIGIDGRVGDTKTDSTTTTRAHIGSSTTNHRIRVFDTLDVDAIYTNNFAKDLLVASVATTGAGAGARADHEITSTVAVDFGNNLQIEAGNIDVDAVNTSQKLNGDETSLHAAAGAILLSVANATSETDITHTTTIDVNSGVTLLQRSADPEHQGIALHALNKVDVKEKVKAQSYGLIALSGLTKADIDVTTTAGITVDASAVLDAQGDLTAIAHSLNRVRAESDLETGGAASGGTVRAETTATTTDTITIGGTVLALGELALVAGTGSARDLATTDLADFFSVINASAHEQHYGLFPKSGIFDSSVGTIYNRNHRVNIQGGAEVASGQDTFLIASHDSAQVHEVGTVSSSYTFKSFDNGPTIHDDVGVVVNGTVRARRVDEKALEITQSGSGINIRSSIALDGEPRQQYGRTETFSLQGTGNSPQTVTFFGNGSQTLNLGRYATLNSLNLSAQNTLSIPIGYKAILYSGENFQGTRTEYTANTTFSYGSVGSLEIVVDTSAISYTHTTTSLANLVDEQYEDLQRRLNDATSNEERSAIQAEIDFLNAHATTSNQTVHLVQVDDTHLDLGDIFITGNYFKGSGTVDGAASSKIRIQNDSNASLKVNNIDVSSTGGDLYFNYIPIATSDEHSTLLAAINHYNEAGADQASFSTVKTLESQGGRPEVDIRNRLSSQTALQLAGDINNLQGSLRTRNVGGDTTVNGNLRAHTIDISTGGNYILSYIDDVRHTGSVVESQWWNTARESAGDGVAIDYDAPTTSDTPNIVGANVLIAAEYINVNGTIQAGSDHSVVVNNSTAFNSAISQFNTLYANNPAIYRFDLNVDPDAQVINTVRVGDKPVGLKWNARDQRLEVQNIDVEGGNLELHGHIFSTGAGKTQGAGWVLPGQDRKQHPI